MKELAQPTHDVFCPICNRSIGVYGIRTETYHQYPAYCRTCGQEFVMVRFKPVGYGEPNYRGKEGKINE